MEGHTIHKRRLRCIDAQRYGGTPSTSINHHSERRYEDTQNGELFVLSRTLDAFPPFFEAYGPFKPDFRGTLPSLKVGGQAHWGSGLSWNKAQRMFLDSLGAVLVDT